MLIGTSNTNVQLLWALCDQQLNPSKVFIDPRTGSIGRPNDWFYAIRNWDYDQSIDVDWPAAGEVEYFDGMGVDKRYLFPTVE